MDVANSVKPNLVNDEAVIGMMVFELATPGIPYVLARAGLDFAIYDMESTSVSWETLRTLSLGSHAAGIMPIVRLPSIWPDTVGRALDLGLMGIMAPKVESAEEALALVSYAKFPPDGKRGSGHGLLSGAPQGMDPSAYMRTVNDAVMLLCQIETPRGVEHADAIAAVEGIDVLSIGVNDLSSALGAPGDFENPQFTEAVEHVRERTTAHGKWFGGGVREAENIPNALATGQRFMWTRPDTAMLISSVKQYVDLLPGER